MIPDNIMDEQKHIQAIESLCRVRGGPVKQNRVYKDHQVAIQAVFSTDIFGSCHRIFDKKKVTKNDIAQLSELNIGSV